MQRNTEKIISDESGDFGGFDTASELAAAFSALKLELEDSKLQIKQLQDDIVRMSGDSGTGGNDRKNSVAVETESEVQSNAETDETSTKAVMQKTAIAEPDTDANKEYLRHKTDELANGDDVPRITELDMLAAIAKNADYFAQKLCSVPEVMDACIALYKRGLIEARTCASPRGMAVIVPSKKPRTLTEAKALADAILAGV